MRTTFSAGSETELVPPWTVQGPKVLVIGSFDLVHYGHMLFLRQARSLGTHLTVALGTDTWQKKYKRDPVLNYFQRKIALEFLPWVDYVMARDRPSVKDIVSHVDPTYLPHGSDWTAESYLAINGLDFNYIDTYDIRLVRIARPPFWASTRIIERAKEVSS